MLIETNGMDILLHNPAGFNDDHRGSDHTTIQLDFHDELTLSGEKSVLAISLMYAIESKVTSLTCGIIYFMVSNGHPLAKIKMENQ